MDGVSANLDTNAAAEPDFLERLPEFQARVEACLDRALPTADVNPTRLHEAMRYAVLTPSRPAGSPWPASWRPRG